MYFFPIVFGIVAFLLDRDGVAAFFWGVAAFIVWSVLVLTVKVAVAIHHQITHRERHPKPAEVP